MMISRNQNPAQWATVAGLLIVIFIGVPLWLISTRGDRQFDRLFAAIGFLFLFNLTLAGTVFLWMEFRKRALRQSPVWFTIITFCLLCAFVGASASTMKSAALVMAPLICIFAVVSIYTGVKVQRMHDWETGPRVIPFLMVWLMPGLIQGVPITLLALVLGKEKGVQIITGCCSLLFGPWATLVAKIGSFPNAGEFFLPSVAIGLTAIMLASGFCVVFGRKRVLAGSALIVLNALMTPWYLVGFAQLMNCME